MLWEYCLWGYAVLAILLNIGSVALASVISVDINKEMFARDLSYVSAALNSLDILVIVGFKLFSILTHKKGVRRYLVKKARGEFVTKARDVQGRGITDRDRADIREIARKYDLDIDINPYINYAAEDSFISTNRV